MVKIRLRRTGGRSKPSYRIVVVDSRSPRDGAFIELIGHCNFVAQPEQIVVNEERAKHWLSKGAQPSDRVARILAGKNIIEKRPIPVRAPAAAAAAPATPPAAPAAK